MSKIITIKVADLQLGSEIGMNIAGSRGQTIIAKGTKVTNSVIEILKTHKKYKIPILVEGNYEKALIDIDRIRVSNDFLNVSNKVIAKYNRAIKGDIKQSDIEDAVFDIKGIIDRNPADSIIKNLKSIKQNNGLIYEHCLRTAVYSYMVAKWGGLNEEDCRKSISGGLYHDIGWSQIDIDLYKKFYNGEVLTESELLEIEKHVNIGLRILDKPGVGEWVKEAEFQHHEKNDQTGYPCHSSEKEILIPGKIAAIADKYDAYSSNKEIYKTPFDVIEKMESEWFECYDAGFFMPFINRISESLIGEQIILEDGRKGTVIFINSTNRPRPIIQIDGTDEIIDMSKNLDINIESME